MEQPVIVPGTFLLSCVCSLISPLKQTCHLKAMEDPPKKGPFPAIPAFVCWLPAPQALYSLVNIKLPIHRQH